MIRVCCYCSKEMGTKDSKVEGVTHGICDDCFNKVMAEIEEYFKKHPNHKECA